MAGERAYRAERLAARPFERLPAADAPLRLLPLGIRQEAWLPIVRGRRHQLRAPARLMPATTRGPCPQANRDLKPIQPNAYRPRKPDVQKQSRPPQTGKASNP